MSEKFSEMIEEIRADSMNGCGSSYECFSIKFSYSVEFVAGSLKTDDERRAFMDAARATGDYMTTDEMKAAFEGCCVHGIEHGYCPAGCEAPDHETDHMTDEEQEELNRQLMAEFAEEEERERQEEIAARDARFLAMVDQIRARNAASTYAAR